MNTAIAATLALAALAGPAAAADAAAIAPLSPEARAAMTGKSWHEGCPVGLDDLAAVKVAFVGFDGADHERHNRRSQAARAGGRRHLRCAPCREVPDRDGGALGGVRPACLCREERHHRLLLRNRAGRSRRVELARLRLRHIDARPPSGPRPAAPPASPRTVRPSSGCRQSGATSASGASTKPRSCSRGCGRISTGGTSSCRAPARAIQSRTVAASGRTRSPLARRSRSQTRGSQRAPRRRPSAASTSCSRCQHRRGRQRRPQRGGAVDVVRPRARPERPACGTTRSAPRRPARAPRAPPAPPPASSRGPPAADGRFAPSAIRCMSMSRRRTPRLSIGAFAVRAAAYKRHRPVEF